MRVIVTGARGQLGFDVCRELSERRIENYGIDINECDLCDAEAVERVFGEYCPDVIVHCAAYTAVDRAETEIEKCEAVNVSATLNIAKAAKRSNAKVVYISTDYVFSGDGEKPFEVDDEKAPLNIYGRTKSDGEDAVTSMCDKYFVIRTSWVFGINGSNFINTMLKLGSEREKIKVVCDQVGSPTYTYDLSKLICDMIVTDKYGVYHGTNEGFCSWFEFASEIMKQAELPCIVEKVLTKDYKTDAKRPLNSRLSKKGLDDAGFERLPPWEYALARYLKEKQGK